MADLPFGRVSTQLDLPLLAGVDIDGRAYREGFTAGFQAPPDTPPPEHLDQAGRAGWVDGLGRRAGWVLRTAVAVGEAEKVVEPCAAATP